VFGVGPQEVVVIVVLLLVVFGPGKAVGMARDLGRFANTARDQVEEFKDELLSLPEGGDEDDHDGAKP
jgi:Sec-independent protein translocase protein TatA